jgi:hypothetical protein
MRSLPRQRELRLAALDRIRAQGKGHSGRVLSAIDLMEGFILAKKTKGKFLSTI